MTRLALKPVAFAAALASAVPALAQTAPASAGVQEIVVTAQKRSTLASKTPLALTVIGGDDLKSEGAMDTRRLADLVPNLSLGNSSLGMVEVAIRGIGSTNGTELGDPNVAVNLDGIYLARPQMAGAALFDVERVEVLRGPQGTLYGRNANAGAINIITKKPTRRFEGTASLGASSYSGWQADAAINLPLSPAFALRAVVSSAKRDGTIDTAHAPQNNFSKDRSDVDTTSARLHALWNIGKGQSLLVTADYGLTKGAGPGSVNPAVVAANPTGAAGRFVPTPRYEGYIRDKQTGLSAEYKLETGIGELTVLGARRTQDRALHYSVAGAPSGGYNFAEVDVDSLEARLASAGTGPLQWVAGLYAFREKDSPVVLGVGGATAVGTLFYQDPTIADSKAVFGQLSYAVKPELRFTAGLRSTNDERSRRGCSFGAAVLVNPGLAPYLNANALPTSAPPASLLPACPAASINNGDASYSKSTYRVGVDWEPSRDTLVFFNVSTGFKAGGFNDGDATTGAGNGALPYRPETIVATEAGLKSRHFGGALQLALTAFHYDYTDLQVSAVRVCANGANCNVTQNAAKAKVDGLELEGRWQLTSASRLNVSATALDARYSSFAAATSVASPAGTDWAGHRLDKAPRATLGLGYTHQWLLPSNAGLTLFVGTKLSSGFTVSNVSTAVHFNQGWHRKSDAHLTYSSSDDRWDVQVYVRNLEDRNVITSYQRSAGTDAVFLAEPRLVGLRGTFRF